MRVTKRQANSTRLGLTCVGLYGLLASVLDGSTRLLILFVCLALLATWSGSWILDSRTGVICAYVVSVAPPLWAFVYVKTVSSADQRAFVPLTLVVLVGAGLLVCGAVRLLIQGRSASAG